MSEDNVSSNTSQLVNSSDISLNDSSVNSIDSNMIPIISLLSENITEEQTNVNEIKTEIIDEKEKIEKEIIDEKEINDEKEKIEKEIIDTYESELSYVNLEEMCNFEATDCYDHMKKFVESYDKTKLSEDIDLVINNIPDNIHISKDTEESKNIMHRFENLLILKLFKRLKLIEKYSRNNKLKTELYYLNNKKYINESSIASQIHNYNIEHNGEYKDEDIQMSILKTILTSYKMSQELLTYELLNYRLNNDKKPIFNENNFELITKQINYDLNRFNLLIQNYLEDKEWILNVNDTLNFSVPKHKVIYSNTISKHHQENNIIIDHMDMLINYIKRCYKVPTLKYVIVEDNKYDIIWILISIGFYHNKN